MKDILIVEDGLRERERLRDLFTDAGYAVSAAESVAEAERFLDLEQFRLAILDIGLGDKSGSSLFNLIRRAGKIPYVIILTGNPSVHLKQRFLDEGAIDYIVKATAAAENQALLEKVRGLLGTSSLNYSLGIKLEDFLRLCLPEDGKQLFTDQNGSPIACRQCGAVEFIVSFAEKPQLPPVVEGKVICTRCNATMDPQVE